ncbi:hypothetical protein EYF80_037054 [Liparis tanakae]|uniref:Uncharacterized protein n=1 Tax=Liparis tanakae TaxID=230148 RepID=A0A4Z2GHF3_9TELE|nr:hypothetical protein EYF80_037054 [Liparis tanakae]
MRKSEEPQKATEKKSNALSRAVATMRPLVSQSCVLPQGSQRPAEHRAGWVISLRARSCDDPPAVLEAVQAQHPPSGQKRVVGLVTLASAFQATRAALAIKPEAWTSQRLRADGHHSSGTALDRYKLGIKMILPHSSRRSHAQPSLTYTVLHFKVQQRLKTSGQLPVEPLYSHYYVNICKIQRNAAKGFRQTAGRAAEVLNPQQKGEGKRKLDAEKEL